MQLTRHILYDSFAILCPLIIKNLPIDTLSDVPIKQGYRGIGGHCHPLPGLRYHNLDVIDNTLIVVLMYDYLFQ